MSPTESTTPPQTGEETQQPTETGAHESTPAIDHDANSLAETSADSAHDHEHDHTHTHEHGPTLNPDCMRQVDVEVPAEEVSRAFASVVKQFRRMARIPGFRAGKVPESVIRRKFADQIEQDVLEQILPPHFRAEIEKQGVQPVSQPQVTRMHLVDGEPMRFQAAFEVLPTIDITGYEQIKVDRPNTTLDDAEFEAELAHVRASHAIMEPVEEDRPLADGDFAQIRFTGLVHTGDGSAEGDAAKPIQGEDATVEIGGPNTVEAFTDALRGAKVGQQMQFEVSYPQDFTEKRLAGNSVAYDVEVKGIRKKMLPELDDAFAKQMGEYETIAQFKEKLREHLANDKRRHL